MSLGVCLLCILLIPLATAGLALIHQGLGRSRSAAHAMFATLCALSVTAIVFVLIGYSWTGYAGGAAPSCRQQGRAGTCSAPSTHSPPASILRDEESSHPARRRTPDLRRRPRRTHSHQRRL